MIIILSGTDRPQSNSLKISQLIHTFYKSIDTESRVLSLEEVPLHETRGLHYGQPTHPLKEFTDLIQSADGVHVVVPEYNGSFPGVLKHFIDFWKYPESFEFRPIALTGLGGRFGGLRPVEHLQQVFGYRNAFIYPDRVFLTNVWASIKENQLTDSVALDLLQKQSIGFSKFTQALLEHGLHAKTRDQLLK